MALFLPIHGSPEDMAVVIFKRLTPLLLGTASKGPKKGGGAAESAAAKLAAVEFVKSVYAARPETRDAVAALARHLCLRAPDKAEFRTTAVKAATALVSSCCWSSIKIAFSSVLASCIPI